MFGHLHHAFIPTTSPPNGGPIYASNIREWPYLCNRWSDPLHVLFYRVGFSRTADLMALFPVRTNPRWRPPQSLKNFKWLYLRNRSFIRSTSCLVIGCGFRGRRISNGAIFDSNKFKMAAAAILDNFEWPYLRSTAFLFLLICVFWCVCACVCMCCLFLSLPFLHVCYELSAWNKPDNDNSKTQ